MRQLRARPELGFGVLFDAAYYRAAYGGPLPELLHFIVTGAFQGANPHPLFDCTFYLRKYPDVAASGVNPLFHYLLHGAAEGRKPHPLFQPDYYLAQLTSPTGHPLLHFLSSGHALANPHPLCDSMGNDPLEIFMRYGCRPVTEGSQFGQGDC